MISVVIPNYNNRDKLYKLLESLKGALKYAADTEVIVVDDCSSEDLAPEMRDKYNFVKIERLSQKSGSAAARNRGVAIARGDLILFLDSDVIVKDDTLAKVEQAFTSNPNMVALEGEYNITPANTGFFPRYKALEYRSFVIDQKYFSVLGPRIGAIRRGIFQEIGGFDDSYSTASVEDYEFSYRLQQKGYKIHYDKTLEVKHHFPESLLKQFGLSFHRTALWAQLFSKRLKFDNFGTTFAEGMGRLAGFIFIVSVPIILFSMKFLPLSLCLFAAYLVLNRRFFILTIREEGFIFFIRALACHICISFFIVAGFVGGMTGLISKK